MSWVISLGAGREQLPIIRAIQHEGHKCLAFDQDEQAPWKDLADAFYSISNRNVDRICETAGWVSDIAGVIAAASEVPDVMAAVAHRLGLPGIPVATGFLLKDKLLYKNVLKAAVVAHTEVVEDPDGSFPTVVKPRVSSGSRGVRHYNLGIPHVPSWSTHMAERYQPGPQVSSETLIWDGRAVTVAFADRLYDRFAHEIGVATPSFWASEQEAAHGIAVSAAHALGIRRGTLKCDLVLTEDGPKIIECTARLSGGPLQELVQRSTDVNYFREAVKIAVGDMPDVWDFSNRPCREVALGMHGRELDMNWNVSRQYIVKELGECK